MQGEKKQTNSKLPGDLTGKAANVTCNVFFLFCFLGCTSPSLAIIPLLSSCYADLAAMFLPVGLLLALRDTDTLSDRIPDQICCLSAYTCNWNFPTDAQLTRCLLV